MGKLSKKVGIQIRKIREARGIKQCSLAEMLDMEPSNLTRIENGAQFPKEENLQKIATNLNVEVKELFDFSCKLSKKQMLDEISSLASELNEEKIQFLYKFLKLYRLTK